MSSSSVDALKRIACGAIRSRADELTALSLRLHGSPELKFAEHQASIWLSDYLCSLGFSVERPAYGLETAFRASRGRGRPAVAILCEYDALPGIGHACGHNVIAAAGVGAAVGLAQVIDASGGAVIVLGTPGEEGGGGKIFMARKGAFEDLDAAMMIHPAGRELPAMQALAIAQLEVEYHGTAAHASAAPFLGVNALDALVTAYNAIAQLRQHIRSTERIHGIITDGGQAPNIVPDRAAGLFYVRAASETELRDLRERALGCFRAGAEATGAELIVRTPVPEYAELISNHPLMVAYAENLTRLGRVLDTAPGEPSPIVGSTDMGNVSKLLPSIHPMIAIAPPETPLHSVEFARCAGAESGQRGVIDGAMAMAMTSIDVLVNEDLRRAMAADFIQPRGQ
jgi:amidohydrolase